MSGLEYSSRVLTDVTGAFYTLVLEVTVPDLATFESHAPRLFGDKEWQAHYQKMTPLVESGETVSESSLSDALVMSEGQLVVQVSTRQDEFRWRLLGGCLRGIPTEFSRSREA